MYLERYEMKSDMAGYEQQTDEWKKEETVTESG